MKASDREKKKLSEASLVPEVSHRLWGMGPAGQRVRVGSQLWADSACRSTKQWWARGQEVPARNGPSLRSKAHSASELKTVFALKTSSTNFTDYNQRWRWNTRSAKITGELSDLWVLQMDFLTVDVDTAASYSVPPRKHTSNS